jgi:hypothetical protein
MTSKSKPVQSYSGALSRKALPQPEELDESDLSEYSHSEEEEGDEEESQSEQGDVDMKKQMGKEAYTSEDEEYEEKIKQKYLDEIKYTDETALFSVY